MASSSGSPIGGLPAVGALLDGPSVGANTCGWFPIGGLIALGSLGGASVIEVASVPPVIEPPRYYSVGGMTVAHRKMLMEDDEALMAILQMFVMEEV